MYAYSVILRLLRTRQYVVLRSGRTIDEAYYTAQLVSYWASYSFLSIGL